LTPRLTGQLTVGRKVTLTLVDNKYLVIDLEEIEARKDCAGEGQQQYNRPTYRATDELVDSIRQGEARHRTFKRLKLGKHGGRRISIVENRYQATSIED
jgi:hypothetical protein